MEVTGIREGYTEVRQDIHRMSKYVESIDDGVAYFRGYVERQEEREMRWI